ncbi:MAG: DJ-1/PfpI family protein [archaeon]|nr:MAG: DJ-1/PfpI family protein [archaeon]
MVIAPENFRDEELLEPKDIFENAGAGVTVASKGADSAKGMYGAVVTVDEDIESVNADEYDAVVFVGGTGASVYFNDETAWNLAKTAYGGGKIVAAICIAPSTLANAGLLEGKKATCFPSEKGNLEDKGATYTGAVVEQDGRIITGNGPNAATEIGQKIAEALG